MVLGGGKQTSKQAGYKRPHTRWRDSMGIRLFYLRSRARRIKIKARGWYLYSTRTWTLPAPWSKQLYSLNPLDRSSRASTDIRAGIDLPHYVDEPCPRTKGIVVTRAQRRPSSGQNRAGPVCLDDRVTNAPSLLWGATPAGQKPIEEKERGEENPPL